ncbi:MULTISPECIES: DUF484 family protein [Pseudomonas]|uniref:DUF484 family protein n=1 Tax=Pseudomonas luteola TaxID=47886 RepID=A0A2X2D1X3_PSELU|nr:MULTISPECIES: DUF484 family protein [Pseudomonas]ENA32602.1 hypothetical protein HMPREF1487_06324 [Pseudomonas sp. HPB0071]MBF8642023.1 DUF484 family protein [Pseudomonas zeshuii]RRW42880.1 DUF484 family protein [Pseudomonas luteola]SHJ11107.1 hypothetical protein SAMN05216295_107226 [Pseudomonas zeshuii]SPZ12993.1 Uncharacterized protein conserved in bacteria [Pseudomonas luteola]
MTDQTPPLDADQVAAWLEQHPDFFANREDLLAEMRIPHQRGTAVSLVERQLGLLRDRNVEMRHRLAHLMDVARDNDRLFDKTRRLVLDLMDANTLEDVISTVEDSLRHEFKVPYVGLILFHESPLPVGRSVTSAEAHQCIGGLLSGGKAVSGALRSHELKFLFGEAAQDEVGSAAVAPLIHQGMHGVLAIGSPDPQHYKSSLGTVFLTHVAEVLSRALLRFPTPLRSVR